MGLEDTLREFMLNLTLKHTGRNKSLYGECGSASGGRPIFRILFSLVSTLSTCSQVKRLGRFIRPLRAIMLLLRLFQQEARVRFKLSIQLSTG